MTDTPFHFHATAASVSGTLTLPFKEQIEVTACATLPPTGGYRWERVENFRHRGIIAVKEAYSYVTGSYSPSTKSLQTATTSVIVGLNLLDMITADRVVARMTSRKTQYDEEVAIIPEGSRFENLRIAGKPVPGLERLSTRLFSVFDTFESLSDQKKTYSDDASKPDEERQWLRMAQRQSQERGSQRADLRSHIYQGRLLDPNEQVEEGLERYFPNRKSSVDALLAKEPVSTSLTANLRGGAGDLRTYGHIVYVEGFGAIRLAEFRVSRNRRQLTMINVDLGCPFEGTVSLCYAESDGSIWD